MQFSRGGGQSWSSYWTTRYISNLAVTTTSASEQTVTATIVGTGFDNCSFEYSTDYGINWTVAGNAVDGIYSAAGLISSTRYDWRARLFKGTNYGAYSNIDYDTTSAHANLIAGYSFDQPEDFDRTMGDNAAYGANKASIYYNGKTYIAYFGVSDDPYIITYTHLTGEWSSAVQIGTNPLSNLDDHGQPSLLIDLDGYIHCFFGSHITAQKYAKSDNPEDISAWTQMTDPIADLATYPQPIQLSNGTIYLFYRHLVSASNSTWRYITSVDGGSNWSESVTVFAHGFAYWYFIKGTGDIIHAVGTKLTGDTTLSNRENVYYTYFNGTNWKNISGTNLSLPIATTADLLAYDSGDNWTIWASVSCDSFNNPYIFFTLGYTEEVDGDGIFNYSILKYNSGWQLIDIGVASGNSGDGAIAIDVRSQTVIDIYLVTGEADGEAGGNIEKWNSIDSGVTWSKSQTILKGRHISPKIVINAQDNARLFASEFAGSDILFTNKGYLWGDSGFIKGSVASLGTVLPDIKELNNGTLVNAPTSIDGVFGKAMSFVGTSSQYINITDNDVFSFDSGSPDHAFSITFWIKDVNTANLQAIISKFQANPNTEWWGFCNSGNVYLACYITTAAKYIVAAYAYSNAGDWDFFCFTYNGNGLAAGMNIYKNGIDVTDTRIEDVGYIGMSNTSSVVNIGRRDVYGSYGYLTGSLDEIKVWDKVLTPAEMALEMANTL
jgi:hypothetical protein